MTLRKATSQAQVPRSPGDPFRDVPTPVSGPAVVAATRPFEAFYQQEYRSVLGLAYALSGSSSGAEDLTQEAFLAAHRNWDKISTYEKPEAWVRKVLANLSVSLFRKASREARALLKMGKPDDVLPGLEAEDAEFWAAVRSLPRRQCHSLALFYLEDRSVADIAEILECSPATVKVHLHKGRNNLAKKLATVQGEESS